MYVSVCADLNQAEGFLPPTTSRFMGVQDQLAELVSIMHHPVETLVQCWDRNWNPRYYVPCQFVLKDQVCARLIFNSDLDFTSIPDANNFKLDLETAVAEGRPHKVTFTNVEGKTLDLNFYSGTKKMDREYMEWDLEAHPGDYDEWVMTSQGPIVEGY